MNKSQLLILMIPVVLFSLTAHEYSHGRIAFLLGDNTAQRLGRLSFNPLKHLDPIGTLFFYFMGFGWAKPVPVDPGNFDHPRRDMMYVAIAGPLCNLALAVACSFFIRIIEPYDSWVLFTLLSFGVYINVALAIFNLLPIFPLDGSSVIKGLVLFLWLPDSVIWIVMALFYLWVSFYWIILPIPEYLVLFYGYQLLLPFSSYLRMRFLIFIMFLG